MSRFHMAGELDARLEKLGIRHPVILPVVRNQILLLLLILFAGTAGASENTWIMWFAAGFGAMTYILFSWARFFLRAPLGAYSIAFLRAVLFHFLLRLVVLAFGLYAAIVYGKAPPMALLAGVAAGTMAPLPTVVWIRVTTKK